jgi:hypothetical protein
MTLTAAKKKLSAILKSHEDWRLRVGVQNRLVTALHEFLEGAFMSGYMQALIDHGLPTGDLTAEIEQRNLTEDR